MAGTVSALLFSLFVLFVTPAVAHVQDGCDPQDLPDMNNCIRGGAQSAISLFANDYGNIPLVFEANQGQFDKDIGFMARGSGYNLYLTRSSAVMMLYQPLLRSGEGSMHDPLVHRLSMNFLDADPKVRLVGGGSLPGRSNYFVGNNPKNWVSGIKHYKNAGYENIYPNIDLAFYGKQNRIEYDFIIRPGANYKKIRLDYKGMKKINIDQDGNLILHTGMGDLIQHAPYAYQLVDGHEVRVEAG